MFGRLLVHEVCSTNKRAYTREDHDVKGRTTRAGKQRKAANMFSSYPREVGLEGRVFKT